MSGRFRRVAILGGGIAGITAAWQLTHNAGIEATLFEASARLGGTVETVHQDGFVIECGPDGWVSEKPWARELAEELGLGQELITSNDADRVTYVLHKGKLAAMPDGMRMMVPTSFDALARSPLFSQAAQRDYALEVERADELRSSAPQQDESVAAFIRRHFGAEVLLKIGAPLLSGVFGGDVARLSVRAVMPAFVQMEREQGSLIKALQLRANKPQQAIFTTLVSGLETIVDRMVQMIPAEWLRLSTPVLSLHRAQDQWIVETETASEKFDAVILAVPAHAASELLTPLSARMTELVRMEATSAVIAAFAFDAPFDLPKGFGFLVPTEEANSLLACTFTDQKFPGRVPDGGRLIRAFFGGDAAPTIAEMTDETISALAFTELLKILDSLPTPVFSVIRRWPKSLPQYAVGHLERMAELDLLTREQSNLWLLGNSYRGVGLPDLIRDARAAARDLLSR